VAAKRPWPAAEATRPHCSPVTQGQITGWSLLAILWFLCSAASFSGNVANRATLGALRTLGALAALILLVWLAIFAATVKCPLCAATPQQPADGFAIVAPLQAL